MAYRCNTGNRQANGQKETHTDDAAGEGDKEQMEQMERIEGLNPRNLCCHCCTSAGAVGRILVDDARIDAATARRRKRRDVPTSILCA